MVKGLASLLFLIPGAISLAIYLSFCNKLLLVTGRSSCFRGVTLWFNLWGLISISVLIASLAYFVVVNSNLKRNQSN